MTVPVEICLKGDDFATNETITSITRAPRAWTDTDVRLVLTVPARALPAGRRLRGGQASRRGELR